jgi:fructose-1,6-bisphosphatase/inositol monophosphatase family enzyme
VTDNVDNHRSDTDIALAAVAAGAAVVRGLYQQPMTRYAKSPTDFATQADLEAEAAIHAVVRAARPDDTFVGKEGGETPGQLAGRRWLVDPLCGTLNFAAGTPLAAVNVALVGPDGVVAAASCDPIAEETFWSDGTAAWLRRTDTDTKLMPSADSTLVEVNCNGTGDFVGPQLVADPQLRSRYGPRVLSSTLPVAWVAAGRRSAYITDGDRRNSVHFAAGIMICEAAGCTVTDLAGDPVHTGRGLLIAADPDTHQDLLQLVRNHL